MGYDMRSKAYRLLDPSTNSIIISRDVAFDECALQEVKAKEKESVGASGCLGYLVFRWVLAFGLCKCFAQACIYTWIRNWEVSGTFRNPTFWNLLEPSR